MLISILLFLMRMHIPYQKWPLVLLILLATSCKTRQESSQTTKNLPELEVHPGPVSNSEIRTSVTKHFDLIHTSIEASFDYVKMQMHGKATVILHPHFYATDSLRLDARGMLLHKVARINGKDTISVVYNYANDFLDIKLGKKYYLKDTLSIYVEYTARPEEVTHKESGSAVTDDKGIYFINPLNKEKGKPRQIWTQSEPQSASVWFPTLDAPNQRMTQQIKITADSVDVTLSNGIMVSSVKNADGTHTDTWKMDLPHAPYLSMMAIAPYAIVKDTWRGKEVSYYIEPEYKNVARKIFGNTPEMMEFFSKKLGVDYPWPKYSQATAREYVSGAMENTTATLHSDMLQRNERQLVDENYEEYVSHELFHQWFGDYVTCESWSNTPLNESFATYSEYLWREYKYGREAADHGIANDLANYLREAETKKVNLIRFQYNQIDDMFDRHSYEKGGCILHLLRKEIGDEAFFASLHLYLERNKFQSVEVHNLRLAFEEVTGRDLNWFFNQWFLDKGHPVLDMSYAYDETTASTTVTIKQLQDTAGIRLFHLNLETDFYLNDTVKREVLVLTDSIQSFTIHTGEKPLLVNVDATKTLPCQKFDHHSTDEWIYQYNHAPLYADRLEALKNVSGTYKKDSKEAALFLSAINDKHWFLRLIALKKLNLLQYNDSVSLKNKLVEIAKNDSRSYVRAMAVSRLDERFNDNALNSFYSQALNDSSYQVVTAAMTALASRDSAAAMKFAATQETNADADMVELISALYSVYGNTAQASYMSGSLQNASSESLYALIKNYGDYLQRQNDFEILKKGIDLLADKAATSDPWYMRFAAMQSLSELLSQLKLNKTNYPEDLHAYCLNKMESVMKAESDPSLKRIYESSSQK